ncbi:MAG: DUF4837 family protein [bacterium]|nr:DUF4837 family protein [bacterium]
MRIPAFLFSLLMVLVAAGCGLDREKGILMAAGSYGDIAVAVGDDKMIPLANRFLESFNTRTTFIIKEEPLFKPDVLGPDRWDQAKGYKNALLLVVLDGGGPVEKAARKAVSADAWARIRESGGGIVQVNDPWSTYQFLVVVASRDRNSLGSILRNNAVKLREMFEEKSRQRILRRYRYDGLDDRLMTVLWERFGFFLEIPAVFRQNQVEPDGFPGIELLQGAPSRGVTVSWVETADPLSMLADREALIAMRTEMGERMHNEEIVPEAFVWRDAVIDRIPSVKLEGAWNSNSFAGGGPFWCYFVPDTRRGRMYCIDLLVYAPGMDKGQFFRRLDALAGTFSFTRPRS